METGAWRVWRQWERVCQAEKIEWCCKRTGEVQVISEDQLWAERISGLSVSYQVTIWVHSVKQAMSLHRSSRNRGFGVLVLDVSVVLPVFRTGRTTETSTAVQYFVASTFTKCCHVIHDSIWWTYFCYWSVVAIIQHIYPSVHSWKNFFYIIDDIRQRQRSYRQNYWLFHTHCSPYNFLLKEAHLVR